MFDGIALLASTADQGTSSISHAFERAIRPSRTMFMPMGFRKSNPIDLLNACRFVLRAERDGFTVISLFNAPLIISALSPRFTKHPRLGILDWTEAYPAERKGIKTEFYNWLYCRAFNRLEHVASPVAGFRKYYEKRGAQIRNCMYPLPSSAAAARIRNPNTNVELLFIGGDYKRKGGDLLLELWAANRPKNTRLTFVCRNPPVSRMEGVKFVTDLQSGTTAHHQIFEESDILILPTRQEPFGYVLLEAINQGIVTVTTENAGASEVVRKSGGLVCSSPVSAIEASFELSQNHDRVVNMSKSCCLFALEYEKAFIYSCQMLVYSNVKRSSSCVSV